MQLSVWTIIGSASAIIMDLMALISVFCSGLILLTSCIWVITGYRMRHAVHLWEGAILAIVVAGTGLVAKTIDVSLPSGLFLDLSQLAIGLLLVCAVFMLAIAVSLKSLRNTFWR